MGAKISGPLVRPGQRALPYMFAPEYFEFCDRVMPAFIGKDIVIEVSERRARSGSCSVSVQIDSTLQKRLARMAKDKPPAQNKPERPKRLRVRPEHRPRVESESVPGARVVRSC